MRHKAAYSLLPWYANGTLEVDQSEEVSEHVASCSLCSEELARIEALGIYVEQQNEIDPQPATDLFERSWTRIQEARREARRSARPGLGERLRSGLETFWHGTWTLVPAPARVVLAAQLVLLLGLLAAVQLPAPGPEPGEYTVLSGPSGQQGPSLLFTVAFVEEISERQMREALLDLDAVVVEGPSSLGFYTLRLPDSGEEGAAAELLTRLRGRTDVFRFVEIHR